MGFKDLDIKISYETTEDRSCLLNSFYIPVLNKSKKYYRIAGYFSSSSLAVASEGIAGLIRNEGIMKLMISPELSEKDYNILRTYNKISPDMDMFSDFNEYDLSEDDGAKTLAWMLLKKKLEIKIVVNKSARNSLFHQKIGIMFDKQNNIISFSGSINETARAWIDNIEEFKTFKSWIDGQKEYIIEDLQKFNLYWNNDRKEIADVYDIPDAINERIIKIAPKDIDYLYIDNHSEKCSNNKFNLFAHQIEAVKMWIDNKYILLFEMATGTGKTRTAIACMDYLLMLKKQILVIISTPQNTLSRQWVKEIKNLNILFDMQMIADSTNNRWRNDLQGLMLDIASGTLSNAVVFATHRTSSSNDFIEIIRRNKYGINIMYICDEVHAIGSDKYRNALVELYDYRVGLSATPERMYDEEGTSIIKDFFGNKCYEFSIYDAINNINPITKKPFLNQFFYKPIFINLNTTELKEYIRQTQRIAINEGLEDISHEVITIIRNIRSKLVKNAENKYNEFDRLILDLKAEGVNKNIIVFVSENQIKQVRSILVKNRLISAKVTEKESQTKKVDKNNTEREKVIDDFKKGNIDVLLGIKCLDEGIDIPNARVAILMSSTTNPREYVQRVGRVLRQFPGKKPSIIYDILVEASNVSDKYYEIEKRIFEREVKRAFLIAQNSINIKEVKEEIEKKGVDLDANK